MKLQRLIAAGLATSVSLATGILAGAANEQTLNIASTMQVPTVEVVMPTDTSVVLNPYGMSVDIGADLTSTDSIISPVWNIQSKTASPLQMSVTAAGVGSSDDIALVDKLVDTVSDEKAVYMVMAYQFGDEAIASTEDMEVSLITQAPAVGASPVIPVLGASPAPGQYVITGDVAPVNDMDPETVPAPVPGVNTFKSAFVDGEASEEGTFFSFRMMGKVNGSPAADQAWTTDDSINVALAFTFQPAQIAVTGALTSAGEAVLDNSGTKVDTTGVTIDFADSSKVTLTNAASDEAITSIASISGGASSAFDFTASTGTNVTLKKSGAANTTENITVKAITNKGNVVTITFSATTGT